MLISQPVLCTQGFNGALTHFQLGTYHALDFACEIGTPVVAVGDGTVRKLQQGNTASGIHVDNLFCWNSLILELDSGFFIEYVHIRSGSARVIEGQHVVCGEVLCESGCVGFCPEPHLHIQAHASDADDAPTIPFTLRGGEGGAYVPIAGQWYDATGPSGLRTSI